MFTTIGRYVLGLWGRPTPPAAPQQETPGAPAGTEAEAKVANGVAATPASATGEGTASAPLREGETPNPRGEVVVRPTVSDDEEGSPEEEEGSGEKAATEGLAVLSENAPSGKRPRADEPTENDNGSAPVVATTTTPPPTRAAAAKAAAAAAAKSAPAQHRPKRQRRTAADKAVTAASLPAVSVASS